MKIAEWIPDTRIRTPNGHFITWRRDGIHSELKSNNISGNEMKALLQWVARVCDTRFNNAEWGHAKGPNILKITCIGFKLENAIRAGMISGLSDIRQGNNYCIYVLLQYK